MFFEKLKKLRKRVGLNQTIFGKRLGVSIDVIKNLENNRTTPTEVFIDHICEIYHVNRSWITGDCNDDSKMFVEYTDDAAFIESLLDQANASPAVRSLVHSWLQLPPDKRTILEEFAEDFAARHKQD